MKKYCILGGGGSFGINMARLLLAEADAYVVGIGRAPLRGPEFTLGIERSTSFAYHQFHVTHEQDLLLDFLDEYRPDVIINFAAQGEGAASWQHSWRFFETNAMALVRLHEALSSHRATTSAHFVHIGTSELYGSVDAPATEDAPIRPSSPYSASKAAFDLHLLALGREGCGMPSTIIRPCNAYCEGQQPHRIIPRAVIAGLSGLKVPLHGGGRAKKSYLHIEDVARAIYAACGNPRAYGEVYNVGADYPTAISEVAARCARAVGLHFDDLFEHADERVGQDSQYWLDSSKAKRDLGWRPQIGWDDGLARVVRWATGNLDKLAAVPTSYTLRA